MCEDAAVLGMLHGPRRSPGIRGTRFAQARPPVSTGVGGAGVPLPRCPVAPLPAGGSGRVHARTTGPLSGCPPSPLGGRGGQGFGGADPPRALGSRCPTPAALRRTELGSPQARGKGVMGGGAEGQPEGEQPRTGGAAGLPAVLRASGAPGRRGSPPRPVPRSHRRCFAASLREDAAGSPGARSPAGSSTGTGALPPPAPGCARDVPGGGHAAAVPAPPPRRPQPRTARAELLHPRTAAACVRKHLPSWGTRRRGRHPGAEGSRTAVAAPAPILLRRCPSAEAELRRWHVTRAVPGQPEPRPCPPPALGGKK